MYLLRLNLTVVLGCGLLTPLEEALAGPDCSDPKHADKPVCNPGGGDDSGSGGEDFLAATFDLTIETPGAAAAQGVFALPNSDSMYSDSRKDKVIVGTLNSSDAFRFDTNSQNTNKTRNFGSGRLVYLVMPEIATDVEIDFRFNWRNGLDLGALVPLDEFGVCQAVAPDVCDDYVAAQLTYYTGETIVGFSALQHGTIAFGDLQHVPDAAADACLAQAGMIHATRTSETGWTLESESGYACRFGRNASRETECLVDSVACDPEAITFALRFDLVMQ